MTNEPTQALDRALDALSQALSKKRAPTRYDARDVLIALGELVLAGREGAVDAAIQRLESVVAARRVEWQRAVETEFELACAEYVHSVDPRYLAHPRYDFEYTVTARSRLEARLRAAERLDLMPNENQLDSIVRADGLLEPYLQRRPRGARSE